MTALPLPGQMPGASLEVLLETLHLLRNQAVLFAGYIDLVQPAADDAAHDTIAVHLRRRCEEVMLEVDLHLSMLNPGVAA
jgi:hypothetical protein